MAYGLNGKVVLVTGAAGGIGSALVRSLLNENVKHVAMLDISEDIGIALQTELNQKYKESKTTFIKCDITDEERLQETFKMVNDEIGYIDLVVNNAGILDDRPESLVKTIKVNLVSVITSSILAWNVMHKERGGKGGTIINFSSVVTLCRLSNYPIYASTKSGVLKFSECLGDDVHYEESGVRVLSICFGLTNTPLLKNTENLFNKNVAGQLKKDLKKFTLQSPESAANAVIEAYNQGASGSVWISTSDKPALDVTKIYHDSIDLFSKYVYD